MVISVGWVERNQRRKQRVNDRKKQTKIYSKCRQLERQTERLRETQPERESICGEDVKWDYRQ
jgi:hypothetical protein